MVIYKDGMWIKMLLQLITKLIYPVCVLQPVHQEHYRAQLHQSKLSVAMHLEISDKAHEIQIAHHHKYQIASYHFSCGIGTPAID